MNGQFHEFSALDFARDRWAALDRLGHRPFGIFQTSRGTWAFWTA